MSHRSKGSVYISNDVLADIAGYAAMESYGIVGMANASLLEGAAQLLPAHRLRRGVRVVESADASSDAVEIDLFVIVEYGTNVAEVSRNLAEYVTYYLEHLTEIPVARCDVHVVDVKVR